MAIGFLLALAAQAVAAPPAPLSFSRKIYDSFGATRIDVFDGRVGGARYSLQRTDTVVVPTGQAAPAPQVYVTDSDACPAALAALERLTRVQAPVFELPSRTESIVDHVSVYRLRTHTRAYGNDSEISVTSDMGTPLARWIDETLAAIRPCWTAAPVESAAAAR